MAIYHLYHSIQEKGEKGAPGEAVFGPVCAITMFIVKFSVEVF